MMRRLSSSLSLSSHSPSSSSLSFYRSSPSLSHSSPLPTFFSLSSPSHLFPYRSLSSIASSSSVNKPPSGFAKTTKTKRKKAAEDQASKDDSVSPTPETPSPPSPPVTHSVAPAYPPHPVPSIAKNFSAIEIKPVVTIEQTQKLIHQIEEKLGFPLVVLFSQENGSICKQDGVALHMSLEARLQAEIKKGNVAGSKFEKVGLYLRSNGGDVDAAFRMLRLLRNYSNHFVVFVPDECSSAATMLSLGSDAIYMGKGGYLSAIDVSVRNHHVPTKESINTLETSMIMKLWKDAGGSLLDLTKHVHPLALSSALRANYSEKIKPLFNLHLQDQEKTDENFQSLWEKLNSGPSHTYPIDLQEARSLGLNAKEMDGEVEEMMMKLTQLYRSTSSAQISYYNQEYLHRNEILNIHEVLGKQIFYQIDMDQYKGMNTGQSVQLNVKSSWRSYSKEKGKWETNPISLC